MENNTLRYYVNKKYLYAITSSREGPNAGDIRTFVHRMHPGMLQTLDLLFVQVLWHLQYKIIDNQKALSEVVAKQQLL